MALHCPRDTGLRAVSSGSLLWGIFTVILVHYALATWLCLCSLKTQSTFFFWSQNLYSGCFFAGLLSLVCEWGALLQASNSSTNASSRKPTRTVRSVHHCTCFLTGPTSQSGRTYLLVCSVSAFSRRASNWNAVLLCSRAHGWGAGTRPGEHYVNRALHLPNNFTFRLGSLF